jgi:CxxC motif-containing protein
MNKWWLHWPPWIDTAMSNDLLREITCIVCPLGCKLTIERRGDGFHVSGNQCKRGEDYAIKEVTEPTRMLTSTVSIRHAIHRRLPVHSSAPLPKELLFPAMALIRKTQIDAPVRCGQPVIGNILGTGVDICASRDMEAV